MSSGCCGLPATCGTVLMKSVKLRFSVGARLRMLSSTSEPVPFRFGLITGESWFPASTVIAASVAACGMSWKSSTSALAQRETRDLIRLRTEPDAPHRDGVRFAHLEAGHEVETRRPRLHGHRRAARAAHDLHLRRFDRLLRRGIGDGPRDRRGRRPLGRDARRDCDSRRHRHYGESAQPTNCDHERTSPWVMTGGANERAGDGRRRRGRRGKTISPTARASRNQYHPSVTLCPLPTVA